MTCHSIQYFFLIYSALLYRYFQANKGRISHLGNQAYWYKKSIPLHLKQRDIRKISLIRIRLILYHNKSIGLIYTQMQFTLAWPFF